MSNRALQVSWQPGDRLAVVGAPKDHRRVRLEQRAGAPSPWGRSFSSDDTLAQAHKALQAYEVHGAKLKKHGFRPPDAVELREGTGMLEGMEPVRRGKQGEKRTLRQGYVNAMDDAGAVRKSCRIEVKACRNVCSARGLEKATSVLDTAYQQTRRGSRVAKELAEQLVTLKQAMTDPEVAPVVAEREADDIIAEIDRVIPLLLDAEIDVANPLGTPKETETMDVLDGIIVTHVRAAYQAAKAATSELGEPSLAKAFETDLLYRSRSSSRSDAGSDSEDAGTGGAGSGVGAGGTDVGSGGGGAGASTPPQDVAGA